jgi:protein-tyrosine phosphatase
MMVAFSWWIDEPVVTGCSNPTDENLAGFRSQGFSVALSLLEESAQPARYDRQSAISAGWSIDSIPVEEGSAPSLQQIREFTNRLRAIPPGTKLVVFCESGLGRTAFMGAVYWIARGLSSRDAIARVSEACGATDWVTADRRRVLAEFDRMYRKE